MRNKSAKTLQVALTMGLLVAAEQAFADININVDILGVGPVSITVADDATVGDLKSSIYDYLQTNNPSIASSYDPNTNTQYLYRTDTPSSMGILDNATSVSTVKDSTAFVLSLNTLTNQLSPITTTGDYSGLAFTGLSAAQGTAVQLNDASAVITIGDSSFVSNIASADGGAIYNADGQIVIKKSVFEFNEAEDEGGAIYNAAQMTIEDTIFTSNKANTKGGAVWNSNELIINAVSQNVKFEDNLVKSTGEYVAIHNDGGEITLNVNPDKFMVFDDKIYGDGSAVININGNATDGPTSGKTGTVTFNEDVSGNTITVYNGTLQLGSTAEENGSGSDIGAPTVAGLNLNGGALSLMNGVVDSSVAIDSITGANGLKFDVDLEKSLGAGLSDVLNITTVNNGATIDLTGVNFISGLTSSGVVENSPRYQALKSEI